MMNKVEMNEEMMKQVNGGQPSNSPVNPYSQNSPWRLQPGVKKENEAK